jgi:RimJ/RimL family protein N-acetyltransferase
MELIVDIITTNRLVLRSACESDLGPLHNIVFSVPEVMSQAFAGKPLAKNNSVDFFASSFDHDGNGKQLGVLTLKNTGTIVGFAGLLECSIFGQKDYEIGFVLGRDYWGKGYASEIGYAQIEYGLGLSGCRRLLALVAPENKPSISVLIKIGMIHHSTVETKDRGIKEIYIAQRHT